ncbi:homoserine kinase [Azohydromonas sp.]|uniref:homoserine kinase n=1 Tax=Azohydromonas sp. TaxID=1872666 RepID=UPI002CD13911|nr:homoserine kinase [Azohydromonas sp.]HMM85262.1 homoserine kinase [Azohydromonas sp.]
MAVFTEVSFDEADALVDRLDIGRLVALHGIRAGIENTNYLVVTDRGEWVLTLFERLGLDQLPFYLHLMRHLARKGLPVPEPRADAGGEILHTLRGKPAALVDRLPGAHQLAPDAHHCAQVGEVLARMHLAVADYPRRQPNLRGLDWWARTVPEVLPHVDAPQAALLRDELGFQQELAASPAHAALPRGPIHADLFRDNVMFDGLPGRERLTGVLDFYFAGVDAFAFDLAVCLNDWCVDLDSGRGVDERAAVLVGAYEAVRPLAGGERRLLPALLRAAALRFWLSRLRDWHLPRDAQLLEAKDPAPFERVLRGRIATPWHPPPPAD